MAVGIELVGPSLGRDGGGGRLSAGRVGNCLEAGHGEVVGGSGAAGGAAAAAELLAPPGDGVALGVVALPADELGQNAPARVDEPVAHLPRQKPINDDDCFNRPSINE